MSELRDPQQPVAGQPAPGKVTTKRKLFYLATVALCLVAVVLIYATIQYSRSYTLPRFIETQKPREVIAGTDSIYDIVNYEVNEYFSPNGKPEGKADLILTLVDGSIQTAGQLPTKRLNYTLGIMRSGRLFDKKSHSIVVIKTNSLAEQGKAAQ